MSRNLLVLVILFLLPGVSGDKIELDPSGDRGSGSSGSYFSRRSIIFPKQKSISIAMDQVASCFIREERSTPGNEWCLVSPFTTLTVGMCVFCDLVLMI